jgi:hypothetical protein
MSPAGFEPAIPATKRQQNHALDRAATGSGSILNTINNLHTSYMLLSSSVLQVTTPTILYEERNDARF